MPITYFSECPSRGICSILFLLVCIFFFTDYSSTVPFVADLNADQLIKADLKYLSFLQQEAWVETGDWNDNSGNDWLEPNPPSAAPPPQSGGSQQQTQHRGASQKSSGPAPSALQNKPTEKKVRVSLLIFFFFFFFFLRDFFFQENFI